MDTNCGDSAGLIEQLRGQLKASEALIAELRQEKLGMEAEFEFKRSKIKDLYFAKDSKQEDIEYDSIRELTSKLHEANLQINTLEDTVKVLTEEMDTVKVIAAVSENTKEEAVQEINMRHQEDIESLRRVLQESMDEQRHDLVNQFEQERRHWEQERLTLESNLEKTQTSLNELKEDMKKIEEIPTKDSHLGLTMEAAQSEAEALKSVVVPLETEIAKLKQKLDLAEKSLEVERNKNVANSKCDALLDLDKFTFLSLDDCDSNIDKQETNEFSHMPLNSYGDYELEKHIENLTKQKMILQNENNTLKHEMHEVCRSLELKISEHDALSQTWKAANEQFLTFQQLYAKDINIIKQFLTDEQWSEIHQRIKASQEVKIVVNADAVENAADPDTQTGNGDFLPFQSHTSNQPSSSATNESLASTLTELQDNLSVSSVSSLPGTTRITCHSTDAIKPVFSAPHLNLLASNDSEEKFSLNAIPAWDEAKPSASPTSTKSVTESAKTTNITEQEILELQEKLLEQQKVNESETAARLSMEAEINEAAEKAQKEIEELSLKIDSIEKQLNDDKHWRKSKETEDIRRLTLLQKDRERLFNDLQQVKKENSSLKTSYEKYRADLAREPALPTSVESLKDQVRKYREALLSVQVEKSRMESQLQSQISFAHDHLNAEQTSKELLEKTLNSELDSLRAKFNSMQESQTRLERELTTKKELEALFEKEQLKSEAVRAKSKDIIKDLKEKLKNETKLKEEAENKLLEAKNQVRSLQDSLETSEHVQQDFVRLSQSLQMQLEDIRLREEREKESQSPNPSSSNSSPSTNHNPG